MSGSKNLSKAKLALLAAALACAAGGLTPPEYRLGLRLRPAKERQPESPRSTAVPAPAAAPATTAAQTAEGLRDAAADKPDREDGGETSPADKRSFGFDPMAYDLPPSGNAWWAVRAGRAGKPAVAVYQEVKPGEIQKLDPKTGAVIGAPAASKALSTPALRPSRESPAISGTASKTETAERSSGFRMPAAAATARGAAARPEGAQTPHYETRPSHAAANTSAAELIKPSPKPAAKAASRIMTPKKFHPVLLSRLLGKDAIRPPTGDIKIPDFKALDSRTPGKTEDGQTINPAPPAPAEVEELRPPDAKEFEEKKGAKGKFHWHREGESQYYHDGAAWGRWDGKNWSWLQKNGSHWFVEAHGEDEAKPAVLMWHDSHWWWKANGVWFLLHEGEAWGYRYFSELKSEGLVNPRTGAQMVYSADGGKVAVITPGRGATLFDSESGQEIRKWGEEEMPKKATPKVPTALSFHPD